MARDMIHDAVRSALVKDGWHVTHDPLMLRFKDMRAFVDLGAQRVLAAERGQEKIAVEIKTFGGHSAVADFEGALGQYVLYERLLKILEPERKIFLAISRSTHKAIFQRPSFSYLTTAMNIQLIIVDIDNEEIEEWVTYN